MRILWLTVVLLVDIRVNGEETISNLIKDIMTTFRLTSPTIVYNGDESAPEVCHTDQWVLCLPAEHPSRYPKDDSKVENKSDMDKELVYDGKHSITYSWTQEKQFAL